MKLDVTAIEKAINSFGKAIDQYGVDEENEFVRDSVIQRFEYSYELASKIIKRYLSITSADPSSINEMSFQELVREAYTKGILKNSWDVWKKYRENRNRTSHGYNEEDAIEIAQNVQVFYGEVQFLLKKLEEYNKRI